MPTQDRDDPNNPDAPGAGPVGNSPTGGGTGTTPTGTKKATPPHQGGMEHTPKWNPTGAVSKPPVADGAELPQISLPAQLCLMFRSHQLHLPKSFQHQPIQLLLQNDL